jgi:hypothetical protein
MKSAKTIAITALTAASLALLPAAGALAKSKPKGAKPTDPQFIIDSYAGKTSSWNSGGFAYWGADGTYRAINKRHDAVAEGKWYVTNRGKLCTESDWRGREDGELKVTPYKACWKFLTDPEGVVWEEYRGSKDWYRHKPEKQQKGDTQRRLFQKVSATLEE